MIGILNIAGMQIRDWFKIELNIFGNTVSFTVAVGYDRSTRRDFPRFAPSGLILVYFG